MVAKYSTEERRRAEQQVVDDVPNDGLGAPSTIHRLMNHAADLQCELNRAVEMLRAFVSQMDGINKRRAEGYAVVQVEVHPLVRDFLSHYPDASPETKGE